MFMLRRSITLLLAASLRVASPAQESANVPSARGADEYRGPAAEFQAPDRSYVTRVPQGWRSRPVMLGTQASIVFEPESGGDERIIVASGPATASSIQELAQQSILLTAQAFPALRAASPPAFSTVGGSPAAEVTYKSQVPGQAVNAWNGMILKDRFFFGILALATPARYTTVEPQARFMLRAMRPSSVPENQQLARAIVGRWTYYQGSSSGAGSSRSSSAVSRVVVFAADGRFQYTGAVSVDTSGGGASGDRTSTGTFRVYGNTLYAQIDGGGQAVFGLELIQGGGLKIDGLLYIRE